jgi:phenylpropionate dioxygenase-like ring-hydroxylating dioxygenase large terminal subunit
MRSDLEAGLVPLSIYNDPELYRLEQERIFGRSWLFVAHETEIPERGDYVARYMGVDPFIVIRDDEGRIRVLFDSCRHHGAQLCRADKGNTSHFRCAFHGWTYNNSGALIGVPNRQEAYPTLRLDDWGLHQAPRVDTYRGLIFASLDPHGVSLAEHLGDFRWYLDVVFAVSPGGFEVIGEPYRWRLDADWKTAAENFCGDGYHLQSLHQSIWQVGLAGRRPSGKPRGVHVTECSGHAMAIATLDSEEPFFWGYPQEVKATFARGELSREQFELAKTSRSHTINVFPNLSFLHTDYTETPGKDSVTVLSMRLWQPRGPGKMEEWNWTLLPAGAPEWYRERAVRAVATNLSASGVFEQDDSIAWAGIPRAAKGVFARQARAKLNYQMGLDLAPLTDWPGPGRVYASPFEEGNFRTFLRHWLRELTSP